MTRIDTHSSYASPATEVTNTVGVYCIRPFKKRNVIGLFIRAYLNRAYARRP